MNRSQILSGLRVEIRRKLSDYKTERIICHWVKAFLDDQCVSHSQQLARWQMDSFISGLKHNESVTLEEVLQAKSALRFLYDRVLYIREESDMQMTDRQRAGYGEWLRNTT